MQCFRRWQRCQGKAGEHHSVRAGPASDCAEFKPLNCEEVSRCEWTGCLAPRVSGEGRAPQRSGSPDLPGPMMGWLGPPGGPRPGAGPGDPSESASPPWSRPRRRRDPPHDGDAPGAGRAADGAIPPHVSTRSRGARGT